MSGRIVVGVDGSPESIAALKWAAEECRCRDAVLHVVTTWSFPYGVVMPGAVIPPALGEELAREAKDVQAKAIDEAIPDDGTVHVEAEVREGLPTWVLLGAAKDATMLVVGSRGLGGFRELLLGSVSQQCAHHAECPVVIVRHGPRAPGPQR
jgi:nucleotide-binding universal stress UspA family protein